MKILIGLFILSSFAIASPVLQMNQAFDALTALTPFLTERDKFMDAKNSKLIESKIDGLNVAFKNLKHEGVLKQDLFAPSYSLVLENLNESKQAFKSGNKDYAHWRLKEITSLCLDCHTRLPENHISSFQSGEFQVVRSKFDNVYNLGIAQMIVRRYQDAQGSFTQSIEDSLIKKDYRDLIKPFKQLLLLETKVLKNPLKLETILRFYKHKNLPSDIKHDIDSWITQANKWKGNPFLQNGLVKNEDVRKFIDTVLTPMKMSPSQDNDLDLLLASGLLSRFLFENPKTPLAPEIIYWIGRSEKYLKQDQFFSSGDLFLKQCIRRYPTSPIAKDCLKEYEESVEFEFTGSRGTDIPKEVKEELNHFRRLVTKP